MLQVQCLGENMHFKIREKTITDPGGGGGLGKEHGLAF